MNENGTDTDVVDVMEVEDEVGTAGGGGNVEVGGGGATGQSIEDGGPNTIAVTNTHSVIRGDIKKPDNLNNEQDETDLDDDVIMEPVVENKPSAVSVISATSSEISAVPSEISATSSGISATSSGVSDPPSVSDSPSGLSTTPSVISAIPSVISAPSVILPLPSLTTPSVTSASASETLTSKSSSETPMPVAPSETPMPAASSETPINSNLSTSSTETLPSLTTTTLTQPGTSTLSATNSPASTNTTMASSATLLTKTPEPSTTPTTVKKTNASESTVLQPQLKSTSVITTGSTIPKIIASTLPSAATSMLQTKTPSPSPPKSHSASPSPPPKENSPTMPKTTPSSVDANRISPSQVSRSSPSPMVTNNDSSLIRASSPPLSSVVSKDTPVTPVSSTPIPQPSILASSSASISRTPTPMAISSNAIVSRAVTPTSSLSTPPMSSRPPQSIATSISSSGPPLPPGVLNTPTSVGLQPLPGALATSSKMPLPPEFLSSSAANNIPLPPGVLTSGPPSGVLASNRTSPAPPQRTGNLPEGIRPMTAVSSSISQFNHSTIPQTRVVSSLGMGMPISAASKPTPQLPQTPDPSIAASMAGITPKDPTLTDPSAIQAVMAYLRKYNLGDTENMLKEEMRKRELAKPNIVQQTAAAENEVGNVLAKYRNEGDPCHYEAAYSDLQKFIENCLDQHKHELALILYPVFVHMYLELVYNQHEAEAIEFMNRYGPGQESYYQEDIKKLSFVLKREHMAGNELIDNFKTSLFTVRMSRDTYQQLRDHKKKNNEKQHTLLWNLIHDHLFLDMYEGHARSKAQIDATAGAVVGEAQRQANRAKVYYGLPREPDISYPTVQEEEEEPEPGPDGEKPKKKKKKELFIQRKSKIDPNAPIATRMPFPDLRDSDKIEKGKALRESMKRANLGPNNIPSICMYTLMNVSSQVTSLAVTDDSSMLAAGLSDSKIKVWSLLNQKLKKLKSASALQDINREAEDVLHRMMDDSSAETCKEMVGHSGPVYAVSFSPDRTFLLSGSEDGAIRLWSMQTWTCLVIYKGHVYPVWDVQFSPLGYYFASCGHDRTARLWTTEQANPLRLFQGHFSDIDCLAFHPNSNYIGTGSSDRAVRLWDCVTGSCVRFMTGHKSAVLVLAFSPDGRFVVSGSSDKKVLIWDISVGHLVSELDYHTGGISGLGFSREGTILASSALDSTLALWDFATLLTESGADEMTVAQNPEVRKDTETLLLASYRTKGSPILHLHFTRRNLLLAIGSFEPT